MRSFVTRWLDPFAAGGLSTIYRMAASSLQRAGQLSPAYSQCVKPPDEVRGFTEIGPKEKDAFRKGFALPSLRVSNKKIGRLVGCKTIIDYSIKDLPLRLKPIIDIPNSSEKFVLFDPAKLKDESDRLAVAATYEKLYDETAPNFDRYYVVIDYNDWNAHACISAILPEDLSFSGFSQVGHIVQLNLREELLPYKRAIGQILIDKIATCGTVLNKLDVVEGDYRLFKPDLLAGVESYVTEVREGKLRFKLDFSKVFWNSRLSTEHSYIVDQLPARSVLYDCCAGVGPFALAAAHRGALKVIANDLNPDSVKWLKTNIKINHLEEANIEVHNLDAKKFIAEVLADDVIRWTVDCASADEEVEDSEAAPSKRMPSSAHVVMNLPGSSLTFLPPFRGLLRNRMEHPSVPQKVPFPLIVHCHFFVKATPNGDDDTVWFEDEARSSVISILGAENVKILAVRYVRNVAPRKEMYCVSFELLPSLLFADATGETSSEGPSTAALPENFENSSAKERLLEEIDDSSGGREDHRHASVERSTTCEPSQKKAKIDPC